MDNIFLKLSIHFRKGKTQQMKAINSYFCHNPGSSGNTRTMYDAVLVSLLLASHKIHISFSCFHCWLWIRKYRLEWLNSLTTYLISEALQLKSSANLFKNGKRNRKNLWDCKKKLLSHAFFKTLMSIKSTEPISQSWIICLQISAIFFLKQMF